jgi:hypothetical protein
MTLQRIPAALAGSETANVTLVAARVAAQYFDVM